MQYYVQPSYCKNHWQEFDNGIEYGRMFVVPNIAHETCKNK